jgi:hypothetical protein
MLDPSVVLRILFEAGKAANEMAGATCPRCFEKSWFGQKDAGKTWFTGKQKVECGKCGKVFTVG